MDTPFAGALIALKQLCSEDLVRQLMTVFEQVARMNAPQLVAAWQTLDILIIAVESDSQEERLIRKFMDAVEARMIGLDGGMNSFDEKRPKAHFVAVLGKHHARRFKI